MKWIACGVVLMRIWAAELAWTPGPLPPKDALAAGESGGRAVLVCRAKLADGVHPGWFEGGACLIPQKGVVERAAEFEFAHGGAAEWKASMEGDPVVAGRQFNKVDLLVCRRRTADGVLVGKAYRTGPHAGHCYVSRGGREIDLASDFEVLHLK